MLPEASSEAVDIPHTNVGRGVNEVDGAEVIGGAIDVEVAEADEIEEERADSITISGVIVIGATDPIKRAVVSIGANELERASVSLEAGVFGRAGVSGGAVISGGAGIPGMVEVFVGEGVFIGSGVLEGSDVVM